jgi:hypothetical protein
LGSSVRFSILTELLDEFTELVTSHRQKPHKFIQKLQKKFTNPNVDLVNLGVVVRPAYFLGVLAAGCAVTPSPNSWSASRRRPPDGGGRRVDGPLLSIFPAPSSRSRAIAAAGGGG